MIYGWQHKHINLGVVFLSRLLFLCLQRSRPVKVIPNFVHVLETIFITTWNVQQALCNHESVESENESTNRRVRAAEMMSLRPTPLSSRLLRDVHIFTKSVSIG
jgi:hypothetical protein